MAALNDRFWAKVLFKEFIRHYRKLTAEQIVADINASMDALEDLDDTGDSFGSKMVRWSMERAEEPSAVASRENGKKGGRPRKSTADGDTREDSQDIATSGNGSATESGTSANIYGDAHHREAWDVSATISNNMRRVPQNEAPAHGFSGGRTAQGTMSRSPEAAAQSGNIYEQEAAPAISTNGPRQAEDRQSRRAGGNSLRVAKVSTSPARSSGPMPEDKQAVMDYASAAGLDIDDAYECWHVTVNERGGLTADSKPINNWKAYVRKWCETRAKRRTA